MTNTGLHRSECPEGVLKQCGDRCGRREVGEDLHDQRRRVGDDGAECVNGNEHNGHQRVEAGHGFLGGRHDRTYRDEHDGEDGEPAEKEQQPGDHGSGDVPWYVSWAVPIGLAGIAV